jgi:hypothetical protein
MASPRTPAHRSWLGLLTFAFALAWAALASAQPGGAPVARDLETAEQAYANLDYAEAGKLADQVLARRGLTHSQLVRATRLRALAQAALGQEGPARDAFVALLAYDPDYRLDSNLSPRIQASFFEARGYWRGQPARPGVEASTLLAARDEGTLRVTLRDPTRLVAALRVGFRWGGSGEMTLRSLPPSENASVQVPPPPPGVRRFDYFVQALNEREAVVFEAGSPEAPKSTVALASGPEAAAAPGRGERSSSFFSSPLFWALVGVGVVAGGATGVYFATRDSGRPSSGLLVPTLGCGQDPCP